MGQKIFCFVIGLSIGGLLLALAERLKALYQERSMPAGV